MHSGRAAGHIGEKCILLQDRAIGMVTAGEGGRGEGGPKIDGALAGPMWAPGLLS